jgi:hypothetical protein
MSVEDRVREALREHAEDFTAHPDAWQQLRVRRAASGGRRAVRRHSWPARFIGPAAAAAAVVAIVVGATVLTDGPHDGSGTPGTSASARPTVSGAPAPPGPGNYLIKSDPPSSAIVPIRLGTGKQTTWTFVWFGHMKTDPGEGIQLCSVTDGGNYYGGGVCASPGLQAQQGYVSGAGSIRLIVSDKQVTSVTAELPNGHSVSGLSALGRGFPEKVWLVSPPTDDNATIVMRNAAGQVVKRLSITGQYPTPSQPRSGGIKLFSYPAHSVSTTAGTMTAYLLNGSLIGVKGKVVGFWGTDSSSTIAGVPASGPPAVANIGGSWTNDAKVVEYYGYAHANVARVVLRLPDGRQYGAQIIAGWPGSGLRLWHFAVPVKAATFEPRQQVILGYDTAGQVVFDKLLSADY